MFWHMWNVKNTNFTNFNTKNVFRKWWRPLRSQNARTHSLNYRSLRQTYPFSVLDIDMANFAVRGKVFVNAMIHFDVHWCDVIHIYAKIKVGKHFVFKGVKIVLFFGWNALEIKCKEKNVIFIRLIKESIEEQFE